MLCRNHLSGISIPLLALNTGPEVNVHLGTAFVAVHALVRALLPRLVTSRATPRMVLPTAMSLDYLRQQAAGHKIDVSLLPCLLRASETLGDGRKRGLHRFLNV